MELPEWFRKRYEVELASIKDRKESGRFWIRLEDTLRLWKGDETWKKEI